MKKFGMRSRFLALLMIPVAGLAYFGADTLLTNLAKSEQANHIISLVDMSARLSDLVHETKREGGMTAGYLGSKGHKFGDTLPVQRRETDAKYDVLISYLDALTDAGNATAKARATEVVAAFESIRKVRPSVDNQRVESSAAIGTYTKFNGQALDVIATFAHESRDASITRNLGAYVGFLLSKERAGIERAVLANVFGADSFIGREKLYGRVISLISAQESYHKTFLATTESALISEYNRFAGSKEVQTTERMRSTAINGMNAESLGVDEVAWFSAQTVKINLLKALESKIAKNVVSSAMGNAKSATNGLSRPWALPRCWARLPCWPDS